MIERDAYDLFLSQWKVMTPYYSVEGIDTKELFLPEDDVYKPKEKRICEEKRIRGFYGRW